MIYRSTFKQDNRVSVPDKNVLDAYTTLGLPAGASLDKVLLETALYTEA
jgi:hypothetical protein